MTDNTPVFMIKDDGGLWRGPSYLVDDLQRRGWKVVINPKRTYYPEHDKKHPNYKSEGNIKKELDALPVEVI